MKAWLKDLIDRIKADIAKAHKSMTIWLNGLAGTLLLVLPYAQDNLPQLQDYVDPAFYKQAMLAIIGLNILLRFKTTKALADK